MNPIFEEIINILTRPPGNLTYHVVLTFSVVGTLLAALSNWRSSQFPQGRRMVIGLCLLLAIRITLFILAGIAWQGLINDHIFYPPVDRATTLISLILIIWMWDFPEPLRLADAATWLLGLLTATGLALSMVWWTNQGGTLDYNGSWPDVIGEAFTIVVILAGSLVLILRKPNSWGFGLGLLGLAFIGHALFLALPAPEGDYAGIVRLFQMAYYPLLLALPQRFPLPAQQAASPAAPPERKRTSADPKLLESFVSLGSNDDPGQICQSLTRAVSTTLLADICLLLTPPDERGEMLLQCGYDLIREENLPGASLSQRSAPLIATALNRGLPLRLPASSTSEDLRTLGNTLHLERPGHLLVSPVISAEGKPLAGILLLSPYSNRAWTNEEQTLIANLGGPMAQLLQRTQALASLQFELRKAQQELEIARTEASELSKEAESLRSRLESLQEQSEKNRLKAESLAALIATQGESRPQVEAAQPDEHKSEDSRRKKILSEPAAPGTEPGYMEGELRLALEEVARLKGAVSEADQRMLVLKNQMAGQTPTDEHYEEIATIVQEMRQPMSSIIGYTDFLLGESVGILGALQRKFLERVKMLTDRMNRLVNELMRLSATRLNGDRAYSEEGTDLYSVVEGAIAESMQGLREKEINLRVDFPESLPSVSVDEDAIKQVLVNLIENAKEVTPNNGEITLHASLQGSDHQKAYILVQVTDQGGGIPGEFIPRVFSRFGYADGKPIPGTGGKSSHLSIVKMLVENSGGRIWVDSQPDEGATFSVLLPVAEVAFTNDAAGGLPA